MLAPTVDPTVASVFAARTKIETDGTVEGYASLFGEIDQARDMVMRGAFAETLRLRGVRRIPMLFQHDPAEPIGVWLELREDRHGLFARGKLIPEVARARELLSLLRAGAIDGLSIGFRTVKGTIDPRTRIRRLVAVDLWEISIVTFPLLAGARVRAVKQAPSRPKLSPARTRAEQDWARGGGA
jgi:HK97 family phage prohead protease